MQRLRPGANIQDISRASHKLDDRLQALITQDRFENLTTYPFDDRLMGR